MSTTVTYKCPNCGAGLLFDAEKQRFACEFCLSDFSEDELDGTEAAKKTAEEHEADESFSEQINEYYCQNCGAQIVADKSTVADFCYFCHNPIVISSRVSGVHKPTKIVPFRFDKEAAKETFLRYAKKKRFVPRDYFSPEQTDKISGIYYPFWVVDSDTNAHYNAVGKQVRSWRSGDYRVTETSKFDVRRGGNIHFEDVTVSAISTEDKEMLEGILPFPLNEHIDFSIPYLQGYTAKKRDIESENISAEVRNRMIGYSEQLFRNTVHGYNGGVDNAFVDLAVRSSHWEYTLMPLWVLHYKRKGKDYTYAMNGATGKIYGELPVSFPKLSLISALIAAAVGALSFLIGWGLFL